MNIEGEHIPIEALFYQYGLAINDWLTNLQTLGLGDSIVAEQLIHLVSDFKRPEMDDTARNYLVRKAMEVEREYRALTKG